ncbi:MAG TPA: hypothetical protein VFQ39_16980, partial [Longimicrobium sp.]|nr:hypothetical protein [Longimicrobium sp.]
MFRGIQRALLLVGLAAAAACADRNPAGVGDVPAAPSPAIRTTLRCEVDVRARRLSCAAPSPETAPGVSAALIGGQGANVRVTSADTRYDAATGTMRSDVTVENLMATALGSTDGAFPTAEGVRLFFHDGPTVTDGSGLVSVLDPDGEATFTGALQPYYQYAGPLAPGAVSAPREWRFSVPATVNRF